MHKVKIIDIINAMEALAPLSLQDDFDNAGLQVGLPDQELKGILVCLDITEAVVDEAIEKGMNMVLSHHPLIFRPLKQVSDCTYQQRCVTKAIKHDIVLYSAHTNLDNAENGVNYRIAKLLGVKNLRWLEEKPKAAGLSCGSGVIGELDQAEDAMSFLKRAKETFHVESLMHSEAEGRTVKKVALCGGAGSFLLDTAIAEGADCFITGEMSYHRFFENNGVIVAAMGHYQSEQFTIDLMIDYLKGLFHDLRIEKVGFSTNPIFYMN